MINSLYRKQHYNFCSFDAIVYNRTKYYLIEFFRNKTSIFKYATQIVIPYRFKEKISKVSPDLALTLLIYLAKCALTRNIFMRKYIYTLLSAN